MLKEIKYVIYFLTVFITIFFAAKFYISNENIKRNYKVIHQHQKQLDKKFSNLPIIKNDTKNIIEYTNEIEKFKNKKQRKFWNLFKKDEK